MKITYLRHTDTHTHSDTYMYDVHSHTHTHTLCETAIYLSHTLFSLLTLFQIGGITGLIGYQVWALNVINGFDFRNGC